MSGTSGEPRGTVQRLGASISKREAAAAIRQLKHQIHGEEERAAKISGLEKETRQVASLVHGLPDKVRHRVMVSKEEHSLPELTVACVQGTPWCRAPWSGDEQ